MDSYSLIMSTFIYFFNAELVAEASLQTNNVPELTPLQSFQLFVPPSLDKPVVPDQLERQKHMRNLPTGSNWRKLLPQKEDVTSEKFPAQCDKRKLMCQPKKNDNILKAKEERSAKEPEQKLGDVSSKKETEFYDASSKKLRKPRSKTLKINGEMKLGEEEKAQDKSSQNSLIKNIAMGNLTNREQGLKSEPGPGFLSNEKSNPKGGTSKYAELSKEVANSKSNLLAMRRQQEYDHIMTQMRKRWKNFGLQYKDPRKLTEFSRELDCSIKKLEVESQLRSKLFNRNIPTDDRIDISSCEKEDVNTNSSHNGDNTDSTDEAKTILPDLANYDLEEYWSAVEDEL